MYVAEPLFAPVEVFVKLIVYGPGPQKFTIGVVKLATTCGQFAAAPNDQRNATKSRQNRSCVFKCLPMSNVRSFWFLDLPVITRNNPFFKRKPETWYF